MKDRSIFDVLIIVAITFWLVVLAVIALLLPRPDKGSEGLLICPDIGIKMPVTMYRHKGGVHYFRELEAVDFAYNGECFFRYDPFQP